MIINDEILRTMNYVNETSCRTNPKLDLVSNDFQSDKVCFSLDYSNIKHGTITLSDEDF